jgi:hypothetical protein
MDAPTGQIVATISLTPTVTSMGGSDSTDTPKLSDFPTVARKEYWKPSRTFPLVASDVIQKYFPAGYETQPIGVTNFYITPYRTLTQPDPQLRAEIALMLSQPYSVQGDQLEYHVQFIARDRPRLSATMRYGNDRSHLTVDAAVRFVGQFISELKAETK